MALLCCLGLFFSRAPLGFDDFTDIISGHEYGTAFAFKWSDCACHNPTYDEIINGRNGAVWLGCNAMVLVLSRRQGYM